MIYEPRHYRTLGHREVGLERFNICVADTDLHIVSRWGQEAEILRWIRQCRSEIVREIEVNPDFYKSLKPVETKTEGTLVKRMASAAKSAGVGPMAAVAGAIAEAVGRKLLSHSETVIVENGGDLFIAGVKDVTVRLVAGSSSTVEHLGLRIKADQLPVGLCTSSGTLGHSVSFGKADAATILAKDVALADAVATETANRVKGPEDVEAALQYAMGIPGVEGVVIIIGETLGALGAVELIRL